MVIDVRRHAAPAEAAAPTVLHLLEAAVSGPLPISVRCWDGSTAGPPDAAATLELRTPRALRRILWSPGELGLVRAYVSGDVEIHGDIFAVVGIPDLVERIAHHEPLGLSGREYLDALRATRRFGALGPPPAPPAEELRTRTGRLHSRARDSAAIAHHYDLGNAFYRLVLGPSMVYSCAYWREPPGPGYGLDDAQRDKLELVCTKLGLRPGMRLLDVGCGWGSLALHAADRFGASVVGITLSREQAALARRRVTEHGLEDLVEIRVQDYRDIDDGPFDAIASVGMAEHVGRAQLGDYAKALAALLVPGGRLLNHAIASVRALPAGGARRSGFIDRYIFPDGEILPLSVMLDALEHADLEVRDSEALREHYGRTLRAWTANLQANWSSVLDEVTAPRARAWLLYLASCAMAFEHGNLTIHQVLALRQGGQGASGMPATRAEWMAQAQRTS